jgi:hypothetical protein
MKDAYSHCDTMLVILADENSSSSLGTSIMGSTPVYLFSLEDFHHLCSLIRSYGMVAIA